MPIVYASPNIDFAWYLFIFAAALVKLTYDVVYVGHRKPNSVG